MATLSHLHPLVQLPAGTMLLSPALGVDDGWLQPSNAA
jgi:hypothetical protein